jgi:hypothetical protein
MRGSSMMTIDSRIPASTLRRCRAQRALPRSMSPPLKATCRSANSHAVVPSSTAHVASISARCPGNAGTGRPSRRRSETTPPPDGGATCELEVDEAIARSS